MNHLVSIVVAMTSDGVIGKNATLPWHLPSDLKRFKALTDGHSVIMGRKTYESILDRNGKPLPNRQNIILTRNTKFSAKGCFVANSFYEALELSENFLVYAIGGAEVYRAGIQFARLAFITEIFASIEGDVYFPNISIDGWNILEVYPKEKGERDEYESRLVIRAKC